MNYKKLSAVVLVGMLTVSMLSTTGLAASKKSVNVVQAVTITYDDGDVIKQVYQYDKNGRIKSCKSNANKIYSYNKKGQLKKFSQKDHSVSKYTYDKKGRLVRRKTITDWGMNSKNLLKYDKKGRIVCMKWGFDQDPEKYLENAVYKYNKKNQIIRITNTSGSFRNDLKYDKKGNLVSIKVYDREGKKNVLTKAARHKYTYRKNGTIKKDVVSTTTYDSEEGKTTGRKVISYQYKKIKVENKNVQEIEGIQKRGILQMSIAASDDGINYIGEYTWIEPLF